MPGASGFPGGPCSGCERGLSGLRGRRSLGASSCGITDDDSKTTSRRSTPALVDRSISSGDRGVLSVLRPSTTPLLGSPRGCGYWPRARHLQFRCYNQHQGSVCPGLCMPVNPPQVTVLGIIMIPLTVVATIGVLSPETLLRHLGGPKGHRAPIRELFLRIAGILLLIGALWTWHEWWSHR